jgi:hypothetical protein
LKQHSIDDVFFALPLCLAMYVLVYKTDWNSVLAWASALLRKT